MKTRITDREITDGFGTIWEKCDAERCGLEVVRPGKVQCWCDGMDMPPTDVDALAQSIDADPSLVAFVVRLTERRCREQRGAELHESVSAEDTPSERLSAEVLADEPLWRYVAGDTPSEGDAK